LLPANGFQRNPRLELSTVTLSRRCHRSPLRQRLRQNLNLLGGLNFGDHYIPEEHRHGNWHWDTWVGNICASGFTYAMTLRSLFYSSQLSLSLPTVAAASTGLWASYLIGIALPGSWCGE
ncbi:MAG: hypothetical protein WB755_26220, partial [Terriglobales bacterium]